MAIAPNVTFVSGDVLTAAQQNAFGFGTCQFLAKTTSDSVITTITTTITLSSFTFIANRNYKITYFEPILFCTSSFGEAVLTIKNTTAVTTLATSAALVNVTSSSHGILQYITTFSAGAAVLSASLTYTGSGTLTAAGSATRQRFLLLEDIDPS